MTTDGKPVPPISDEEEARIQAMIAADPDDAVATDEQLAQARPFAEAFPELAQTLGQSAGGRPPSADPKVPVSLRPRPRGGREVPRHRAGLAVAHQRGPAERRAVIPPARRCVRGSGDGRFGRPGIG